MEPTLNTPSQGGKAVDKEFNSKLKDYITEADQLLREGEQSLKKRIFKLDKAEALIHGDEKLSAIYNEMEKDGREKYGYHYNETIINIIFNEYVINSTQYLAKYKMAVPKEKKRRDKSGINQLHKDITGKEMNESIEDINSLNIGDTIIFTNENGEEKSGTVGEINLDTNTVDINLEDGDTEFGVTLDKILDIQITETTGAASSGAYAGPAAWSKSGKPRPVVTMGGGQIIDVNESSNASSSGQYNGKSVWSGDANPDNNKSFWKEGKVVKNYLTNSNFFEEIEKNLLKEDYRKISLNEDHLKTKEEKVIFILEKDPEKYKSIEELDRMNDQQIDQIYQDVERKTGVNEAAESKAQQRFMGMVRGVQKGEIKPSEVSSKVVKTAKEMKPSDVKDFASTKHDDLPEKVTENTKRIEDESYIKNNSDMYGDLNNMSKENINIIKKDIKNRVVESMTEPTEGSIATQNSSNTMYKKSDSKINGMETGINEDFPCRNDEVSVDGECKKKNKLSHKQSTTTNNTANGGGKPQNYYNEKFRQERIKQQMQQKKEEQPEKKEHVDESLNFFLNELNRFDSEIGNIINEDRRVSALIDLDHLKKQNAANYKQDIENTFIKDEVKKLEKAKDQMTEVGEDPQKLAADLEKETLSKTKGESFKNVGDSDNEKGNEIPKRNLTTDEADQLMLDRGLGIQDIKYSNKPSEKFEERMKEDMGEDLYAQRQKKMEYRAKAPMYNKDTMPTEKGIEKNQYNESYITGKYKSYGNSNKFVDFKLSECIITENVDKNWIKLGMDGLGNMFDAKVGLNESVAKAITKNEFYFDGENVYQVKVQQKNINESVNEKPINDGAFNKIQHLLNYNPNQFVSAKNTKFNRGF